MKTLSNRRLLQASPYAGVWNKINRIQQRLKDRYRGSDYFPIGTRRPIYSYDSDVDIPESEIEFFKLDTTAPNDASSICMIGMSGTFKTTLIKTMTFYNSFLGNTKIGVLDLKGTGRDWYKVNKAHRNKGMIFQEPATMPFVAGCPNFALQGMPPDMIAKERKLNLPVKELADLNILTGLGFSPIAKQHAFKMFRKNFKPLEIYKVTERMYEKKMINKSTFDNMSTILDTMIRTDFLMDKNIFDQDKIWDSGSSWALGFNDKAQNYLSVYVDKILTKIFDRANRIQNERYWVVVDDCQKAFGADSEKYPSVQTGISSLTLWRSRGINMVFGVQSPTMLDKEMYSDIKHFFIYRCSNAQVLANYIPNREIIDNIKTLMYRPEQYISECIHVMPDRFRFRRFFPCNAPIAT